MRLTSEGWFGDGIYFARSYDNTFGKIGKDGGYDALIVALVDMGNVKYVNNSLETESKRHGGTGRDVGFDSIYVHGQGVKKRDIETVDDEFLVYDPQRIVSFIVCV